MNCPLKAETNGSGGAKNVLTRREIADCDGIIIAADKNVEMDRFDGKPVLFARVDDGIHKPEELIKKIESGEEHFDFVEVMACPGGCVAGAGQPFARSTEKRLRAEGLYKNDKALQIKRSENNPIVKNLYDDLLKNREHELLHVSYVK